jgi:hypothetical protein
MATSMNDREVTSTATSPVQVAKPTTPVASGAVSALAAGATIASKLFGGASGFKLPLANPLHKYASYTQIFTLACMSSQDMANPSQTFLAGGTLPIILKTQGSPNNRIKTPYGAFDFFMDDVQIKSIYGFSQGTGNSNATLFDFSVIEPYSMGMFTIALNVAAQNKKYSSFLDANFLLKIEFKGEDQNGNMITIPKTTKYLPIKFRKVDMSVTESGATYKCQAHASSDGAHNQSNAKLLTNITIKGSSVIEMLQRGPDSLQSVVNRRLRETAFQAEVKIADEIVIIFPDSNANLVASTPGEDENESAGRPTPSIANKTKVDVNQDTKLFGSLNLSRGKNDTLIQSQVNAIGASQLTYDETVKPARSSTPTTGAVTTQAGTQDTTKLTTNSKIAEFSLPQDSTIQNAINQVLYASEYAVNSIKTPGDSNGMKKWWRIETGVYDIDSAVNNPKTGAKPKLFVYKVVPYMYHETALPVPGSSSPSFSNLLDQCVKVYNYIFTGKNQDILKFNLDFDSKFLVAITSGLAESDNKNTGVTPQEGDAPKKTGDGGINYRSVYTATHTTGEAMGAGGKVGPEEHSVRLLADALVHGYDIQNLEMDIVGDPYYLTGNGLGNYSSPADPQYMNINQDGSINYQNGEVDIAINFKTPLDINPSTGLFNMAGKRIGEFSGLYKLRTITHKFRSGQFTQTIIAARRPLTANDVKRITFKLQQLKAK